jgi:ankyrin repeat protein
MDSFSTMLLILRAIAQTTCTVSLEHAIHAGNVEHVWLALELGATVDDAVFMCACELGCTEIVRMLLEPERGVDPAARNNHALRYASTNGQTAIVRLLLELSPERGVNPAAHYNESLTIASYRGHTEIVRLLLDLPLEIGVNPDANNNEALRIASERGYTEIVRLLLELPLE